jgi:hypothetical protein
MSVNDALTRISQIETQLASLTGAASPPAPATSTTAVGSASAAPPPSFADALAQAQKPSGSPSGPLTSGQREFASRLAAQTGLDPQVISAWLLAEESGGAATTRQSQGNNDWLNIGYTDSATYGSSDSIWSNPDSAADATAGWLKGQNTVPGYGPASAGIRAILTAAGQPPQAQVAAIQSSGWASSGYPDLPGLYRQVSGSPA